MKVARNVLIIVALAAAVAFLPGGGAGVRTIATFFSVLMFGGLAWWVGKLYMEHRYEIFGLGDRNRALLYGAFAVIVLTLAASSRLLSNGAGIVVWLVLMSAAVFALYTVWRAYREASTY
jgi:hypothetical protein